MFTGIIENLGVVRNIERESGNVHFKIETPLSAELKIDQSVAHDGVCLTVVKVEDGIHTVTAISETLQKTNLGDWSIGDKVNIERCMPATGRFDGHIVQGHVDTTAICTEVVEDQGSWRFYFSYKDSLDAMIVEKGSITINGVSLTVVDSSPGKFSVAIIPYTYTHTGFAQLKPGKRVNLEFDIVGKYVAAMLKKRELI